MRSVFHPGGVGEDVHAGGATSTPAPAARSAEPAAGVRLVDAATTDPMASPARPRRAWVVRLALGWLTLLVVLSTTADLLPFVKEYDALQPVARLRPFVTWSDPLGTDELGRSMLSRLIYGSRVSLLVGLGAVVVGIAVGGLIGMAAGYFGGRVDWVVGVLLDSFLAFPSLILMVAITSIVGQTYLTLILALSLLAVPSFARLARANTLSFTQREFVMAARSLGAGHRRILFHDLLPNVLLPVLSYAFVVVATVIVAEGSLSFLGMGMPPPQPSWGGMIASGRSSLSQDPHIVFVPAVALLLTVFSFNVVGDAARRRVDTRSSAL